MSIQYYKEKYGQKEGQLKYNEFLAKHDRCNFQQSVEWGKVKEAWTNEIVLAEDKDGNIIGINTIKITTAEGIGFAIPINIIKPIIEKYEMYGEFKEAYLGIFAYDGSIMSYVDENTKLVRGVYIEKITEDGPANNTELEKGDIIIRIDNTSVNKMCELQEYIFSKDPGDEIILTILRNNKERQIKVVLGEK